MANNSFTEKRAFQRFPVVLPIAFSNSTNDAQVKACTQDISAQGICMITEKPLTPGTELEVFLYPENNTSKILRKGTVVWFQAAQPSLYRIGVRLNEPNINPIPLILQKLNEQLN